MKEIVTEAPEETVKLGIKIGKLLKENDIVGLYGELGAGKTLLIKGIVKGAGISEEAKSPSFTIITTYRNRKTVYHIDLYRIEEKDLKSIDFYDFLQSPAIVVIEWAEKAENLLPPDTIKIRINILSENKRRFQIEGWIEKFI